ncbi:F0F1 ATP synthase subunit epsilon [Antarcticimicrobium luteum]|uniref:F0F1 ATP synthase subunit epsilon n=2 Tax=Antarcticimicrobium luteum TaxID=2547397 RepID=A0A4V3AS17_9RHOB|nr:F0F1 ATP synthase subunit epsilon [Antarcticimicrobium luteum]
MALELSVPGSDLVNATVRKLAAEGAQGAFVLLPRHIDMVAALKPGLLSYVDMQGQEHFLGIDEGTLVKCGRDVRVAVLGAFVSDDLASLRDEVARQFLTLDDSERAARTALARLEAGAIRGMMEFER